ncbi:hypothetical protein [Pseudonocardia spirodelae]|uniref:Uncharacterized protein n=1 Tax=Pseudonocardia spirodelae TaxID=3133431 RepID=A0ABU8T5Q6_9PSEU
MVLVTLAAVALGAAAVAAAARARDSSRNRVEWRERAHDVRARRDARARPAGPGRHGDTRPLATHR